MNKTFIPAIFSASAIAMSLGDLFGTTVPGITVVSGSDNLAEEAQKLLDAKLCEHQHAIPDAESMLNELIEISMNALFVGNQRYQQSPDGSYPWEADC